VGGYRVIDWTHGTTGMAAPCGPSLFTNLDGQSLYLTPYLDQFLAADDVIVATDYEGLGAGGIHPYLVGASAAMNSLDAVRAAAKLPGLRLSPDVVVIGHSQGGQAALFTGEIAPSYSPDLRLLGVVAIAPATNISAAITAADYLTSRGGISDNQGDLDYVAMALWAWTHTYRALTVTSVFTPVGASDMKAADSGCLPQIAASLLRARARQLFRSGAVNSPAVQHDATLNNPGQVHTAAPILVVQGTDDPIVPYALTEFFVRSQACAVGDRVSLTLYPGAGHGGVIPPARHEILSYVADRFAGRAAPSGCLPGANPPAP
jgi:pimeloyl-ACP methyl ester carboxylesterase